MRNILLALAFIATLISCKNENEKTGEKKDSTAFAAKPNFVYTAEKTPDWQWGSNENIDIAMKCLKAWESGDVNACSQYFADTLKLEFDGFDARVTKDSANKILAADRKNYKSVRVRMNDYESVKSKDGESEYVSLWYTQYNENMKGKTDSIECMNDIRIKGGKITLLNEKTRHYGAMK